MNDFKNREKITDHVEGMTLEILEDALNDWEKLPWEEGHLIDHRYQPKHGYTGLCNYFHIRHGISKAALADYLFLFYSDYFRDEKSIYFYPDNRESRINALREMICNEKKSEQI